MSRKSRAEAEVSDAQVVDNQNVDAQRDVPSEPKSAEDFFAAVPVEGHAEPNPDPAPESKEVVVADDTTDGSTEPVRDDEGTVIQPGRKVYRKRGDNPDVPLVQDPPDAGSPEAQKRSVEEQRAAIEEGRAPDPTISGWDSDKQVAISPGANPENYLRSPGEVRADGDV